MIPSCILRRTDIYTSRGSLVDTTEVQVPGTLRAFGDLALNCFSSLSSTQLHTPDRNPQPRQTCPCSAPICPSKPSANATSSVCCCALLSRLQQSPKIPSQNLPPRTFPSVWPDTRPVKRRSPTSPGEQEPLPTQPCIHWSPLPMLAD